MILITLLCFLGKSTVNLLITYLLFPETVPYKLPWPSITINPKGYSFNKRLSNSRV